MQAKQKTFFLTQMGPTLEVLAFFSSTKVVKLLRCVSKKGHTFLEKREQDILQVCVPSIFDAKMTELPPFSNLDQNIPVLKVLHLAGNIFFVVHINGLVVKVDFDTPEAEEPLDSFQIPCEEV